jgi:hypothetical protein
MEPKRIVTNTAGGERVRNGFRRHRGFEFSIYNVVKMEKVGPEWIKQREREDPRHSGLVN